MADNVRLTFSKTGRARFISHLDLMRVFQRAFYRAELPLRYSQGFNPHAYVSIALPLSVGQAGLCEPMDVGVTGEIDLSALPAKLNALLPEGIEILSAVLNARPVKEIVWARYHLALRTQAAPERFHELLDGAIMVDKRSKKGTTPTDIRPMIRQAEARSISGGLFIDAELAAQNPTLNAEYVVKAFAERYDADAAFEITRVALLDGDGYVFT